MASAGCEAAAGAHRHPPLPQAAEAVLPSRPLRREESRAQPFGATLPISPNSSSSRQLPQKEIQKEIQKPPEAPAASISHPPLTKDEPLCKLPALGTDPGCRCRAQAVRATAEPPALWDLRRLRQAASGKSKAHHGPRQEQSEGSGGCCAPRLALVSCSQPLSPRSPSVKTGLAFLGFTPHFYSYSKAYTELTTY